MAGERHMAGREDGEIASSPCDAGNRSVGVSVGSGAGECPINSTNADEERVLANDAAACASPAYIEYGMESHDECRYQTRADERCRIGSFVS